MLANDLPIVCALGDSAVLVEFGDKIDPLINQQVYSLDAWLKADTLAGVLEFIPAYTSLVIQYDSGRLNVSEALAWLNHKIKCQLFMGVRQVSIFLRLQQLINYPTKKLSRFTVRMSIQLR